MKANGLENRKVTASSQWSMLKRIKIDDNEFLQTSNLIFCPTNKKILNLPEEVFRLQKKKKIATSNLPFQVPFIQS